MTKCGKEKKLRGTEKYEVNPASVKKNNSKTRKIAKEEEIGRRLKRLNKNSRIATLK